MSQKVNANGLRWMIWTIIIIIIITIGLAWVFYSLREPYEFFQETISMLGGLHTENGYNNFPSYAIFTFGFLSVSVLALVTGIVYITNYVDFNYAIFKGVLMIFIAVGTFGTAIMYDLFRLIHGIGAFVFITAFGIFNFVCQVLRFVRKHAEKPTTRKWDYYVDFIMVIILFITIAAHFMFTGMYEFLDMFSRIYVASSQKVLLIVIIITVFFLDRDDM
ncbi:MAG: hypothetical protein JW776_02170 [Candidatus Lokiarchaeota archaeon]|nr:hypothetical protein [Candidatus Lokiarchaeota archaeon]